MNTNNNKIETNNPSELKVELENIVVKINDYLNNPKYVLEGDIRVLNNITIQSIKDLGICDIRRLKRFLNKINYRLNLDNINRLFRFLKSSGVINEVLKIREPKHETIQKLRKEWIELRNKADEALLVYKGLKSDYYKSK